jgi:hypothetical protein
MRSQGLEASAQAFCFQVICPIGADEQKEQQ